MVVDHSDFEALTQAIKQADTIVIGPGLGLDKLAVGKTTYLLWERSLATALCK